jgi:hypothetical protein
MREGYKHVAPMALINRVAAIPGRHLRLMVKLL